MNTLSRSACASVSLLIGLGFAGQALADRDEDERGHGRKHSREYKEEFWDGNCKVKRKWEKDGGYEEERKCEGRDERRGHVVVVQPAPVVVYPPWMVVEQGVPEYRRGQKPAPVQGRVYQCNSSAVGPVLGGITGAAVGNRVGKGSGRAAATVGGAVIGVLIGGEIGRQIDRDNQACIGQALEFAPTGQRIAWPAETGAQYAVVPGQVVTRKGQTCRTYGAEVQTSSGWQKTTGVACRRADGVWVPAS